MNVKSILFISDYQRKQDYTIGFNEKKKVIK